MQEDPNYVRLMKKSFIMNKYHQEHPTESIPKVKKEPRIVHKALTTGVLTTLAQIVAYPFDTIKTRKMAKNAKIDVARFNLNQVVTKSTYLGFFTGYLSVMAGSMCFLAFGQINFFLGVAAEGIVKTWIDISKINAQMANASMDMSITKKALPTAVFFSIARDLTSRGSYMLIVDYLLKSCTDWLAMDTNRRFHIYFGSAIAATLISHPFDLIFTKIASQRDLRYKGIFSAIQTIYKDEGLGKFLSGLDHRLLYNLVSIIIIGNCYGRFMEMAV